MRKWGKKKILLSIAIIIFIIIAGFVGYSIYGSYKLNQLSGMSFEEMLDYATKDHKEALITVGIIQDGNMTCDVYGENGVKLSPQEHIYEIGSITKTFTASLVCKAIGEGRVSPDDSIDEYLNLEGQDYYPTIRRLVTHTSGYEEYYFETPMISSFFRGENSFAGISKEMLLKKSDKICLHDADYPFTYSNFGFAVLGAVLEKAYNQDYTLLMNAYISEELGLENTRISDGSGDLKNRWQWSQSNAYMPAGALLSDITDMMQYLHMQMRGHPQYTSFAHEALAKVDASNASYEKMGIRIDAVGTGWMIDDQNRIIWHNGATGHYNSYVGFDKERQIGVVVLSNLPPDYRVPATVMGVEILTSLQK
jgi:CubicO group peptidase (beta-lactamase class C family)